MTKIVQKSDEESLNFARFFILEIDFVFLTKFPVYFHNKTRLLFFYQQ